MKLLLTIFLGIFLMTCLLIIWPPVIPDQIQLREYQIDVTNTDSVKLYDGNRFVGAIKMGNDTTGLIGLINLDNQ